jgi:hypothetical protein
MSEPSELSADAESLVEAGRHADAPSAGDKQRIKNRLAAELGAGAFVVAAVSTTLPAALRPGAGAPALASPSTALRGPWQHALVKAAAAASAVGALYVGAATLRPGAQRTETRAPMVAAQVAPSQAAPEVSAADSMSPERDIAPTLVPSAPQAPETKAELPAPREPAARARAARLAPRRADDRDAHAPQAPSTLGAELALLSLAQRALREHQPERALELAQQHAARFGSGRLAEERRGIEALAHCQLGQPSHAAVAGFLALAPHSPLAARVQKECGLR